MKRVFGKVEAVFDLFYLAAGLEIGLWLLRSAGESMARLLAGIMALVLAGGDAFHLIPRVRVILSGREEALRGALGRGKQITSITMTVFYLLLWQIGLLLFAQKPAPVWTGLAFLLAAVRIFLCLMPQNRWQDRYPPISWGIWRNIPFFLLGAETAAAFFLARAGRNEFRVAGHCTELWLLSPSGALVEPKPRGGDADAAQDLRLSLDTGHVSLDPAIDSVHAGCFAPD